MPKFSTPKYLMTTTLDSKPISKTITFSDIRKAILEVSFFIITPAKAIPACLSLMNAKIYSYIFDNL
ncbi:hypothetical protein NUKP16_09440 [Klebsiella quasipneumoniae]|nr:hypothetical protein NUKP16_09440 [Klebsiella quasipneumoniae]